MNINGKDINRIAQSDLGRSVPVTVATNTTVKQVTGTAETSLLDQVVTLTPDDMKAGSVIMLRNEGVISTQLNITGTITIKLGATVVKTSSITLPNSLTNSNARLNVTLRFTATGVWVTGETVILTTSGLATTFERPLTNTSEVIVDTLTNKQLDVTYSFGSGVNNLSIINSNITSIR